MRASNFVGKVHVLVLFPSYPRQINNFLRVILRNY